MVIHDLLALRGIEFDADRRRGGLVGRAAAGVGVPGMFARYLDREALIVGPGTKTGMPIRVDNPRELGADRLVNAVAGYERCRGACVIVDFGTAITYDAVSGAGRVPGRHHHPGHRDLDRGADVAGGPAAEGRHRASRAR